MDKREASKNQNHQKAPQLNRYRSEEALGSYISKPHTNFASNIPFPQIVSKNHTLKLKPDRLQTLPASVLQLQPTSQSDPQTHPHPSSTHKLPHYTIFDDKSQFNHKTPKKRLRCNSVDQLKSVIEDKKQNEPIVRQLSRFNQFIDNDEFNHMRVPDREGMVLLANKVELIDDAKNITSVKYHEDVEPIREIEEPREVVQEEKTALESAIDSIVVDEVEKVDRRRQAGQEEEEEEKPIEAIVEVYEDQGQENLEKAQDRMMEERQIIMKTVRNDPVVPHIVGLKSQNLKPFADAIKQEANEQY